MKMKFHLIIFAVAFGSSFGHRPYVHHHVEESNLSRPCKLDDIECMQRFLATNGHCTVKHTTVGDPLYTPRLEALIPAFNVTLLMRNLSLIGLSRARVIEFGQSKTTGNLVIAINIKDLMAEAIASVTFQRRAQESITLTDHMTLTARSITPTAIIPRVPHLEARLAEIHTSVDSKNIKLTLGPGITDTENKQIQRQLSAMTSNLPLVVMEMLATSPSLIMTAYVQESLCDFGIRSLNYYSDDYHM